MRRRIGQARSPMPTSSGADRGRVWNRSRLATLVILLLVALNLRLPLAAVGPVLDDLRVDLAASHGVGGLLTTLPLVCFGVLAPATAYLGGRWSGETVLLTATVVLAAGIVLRSTLGLGTVLIGTVLIGAGIGVGNVLIPVLVKQHLAAVAGVAMSLYTAFLTGGAAIGAAGAAGFASLGWGWRVALLACLAPAVPAVVGFGWWYAVRRGERADVQPPAPGVAGRVWRSGMAWWLAVFMGGQSLLFYTVLTWLPALLEDRGVSLGEAGLMASLFSLLGIAGAMAVPPLAVRGGDQRAVAVVSVVGWLVGLAGLWWVPQWYVVWSAWLGVTQGGGIAMALTLIVLRAGSSDSARHLSAMVQMTGYFLAAVGPWLIGVLRDRTGGWSAPLAVLLALSVLLVAAAFVVGRHGTVD